MAEFASLRYLYHYNYRSKVMQQGSRRARSDLEDDFMLLASSTAKFVADALVAKLEFRAGFYLLNFESISHLCYGH